MLHLPKNLYFLRKRMGKNQAEMGAFMGKGGNTIGNWENGMSQPNINEIVALADYFGVTLQDMVLTDLENTEPYMSEAAEARKSKTRHGRDRPYPTETQTESVVNDDGGNFYWILLQEVRRNTEKLDHLIHSSEKKPTEEAS